MVLSLLGAKVRGNESSIIPVKRTASPPCRATHHCRIDINGRRSSLVVYFAMLNILCVNLRDKLFILFILSADLI